MNDLVNKLKTLPTKAINLIALSLSLGGSGLIIFLAILPSYMSLSQVRSQISDEEQKLSEVKSKLDSLRNQNPQELSEIKAFINTLVPDKIDILHFTALNELIANSAGASVTNFTVIKTAPKAATPAPAIGVERTQSSQNQTTTPAPAVQPPSTTIKSSYNSNFTALVNLLSFWFLADQIVGIKDITLTSVSGSGTLSYTITYDLPEVTPATGVGGIDEISLTAAEREKIQALRQRIIYTATPSANPVGESDPFQ